MSDADRATQFALAALSEAVPTAARPPHSSLDPTLVETARRILGLSQPPQTSTLDSIFNQLGGTSSGRPRMMWPLAAQNLTETTLFPVERQAAQPGELLRQLWQGFQKDWQSYSPFVHQSVTAQLDLMLSLLARYAWSMPSTTGKDVSLYDEARVAAALTACLSSLSEIEIKQVQAGQNQPVAQFVEGDISGIQRFLYTIPSKGAAKQLRARSLYLQLLTEAVARFILQAAGMPMSNLIYAGGGHFYLLLPPNVSVADYQSQIDQRLLRHHDGELAIALGSVPLAAGDFSQQAFGEQWDKLKQATAQAKRRRYAQLESAALQVVFAPRPLVGEIGLRSGDRDPSADNTKSRSRLAESFEALGAQLTRAHALALCRCFSQHPTEAGGYEAVLSAFGLEMFVLDDTAALTEGPSSETVVWGLRAYPPVPLIQQLAQHWKQPVVPRLRSVVSEVATKNRRDIASFSELAEASEGIKRLGVLRMDVDDLGTLFRDGFNNSKGERDASLMRIASLSSALSLFFEGWVGELCRHFNKTHQHPVSDEDHPGKMATVETVYAVYSGGDDLFLVGAWDVLLTMAEQIRRDLDRFTGNNPAVHISAGLTLHTAKYPLYRAAEEADEALKAAKTGRKDAITFLGLTTRWGDWADLIRQQEKLVALIQQESIGRTLLQTLLRFYSEYAEAQRHSGSDKIVWGPWVWRTAYQITRLIDRAGQHKADLKELRDSLKLHETLDLQTAQKAMTRIGLAALWSDICTRKAEERES